MQDCVSVETINGIVESIVDELNLLLPDSLVGVSLVGSHAVDRISRIRPDINIVIFFENRTSGDGYWKLGQVWNELREQYSTKVNVRIEFRPFRFIYPKAYDETKPDVCLNPIYADMAERDMDRPFGVPKYVLSGFKHAREVLQGPDVLGALDLQFSVEEMKNDMLADLSIFYLQVNRATAQYDLDNEYGLLFNEAFRLAKFSVYCGIELAMSEEEIQQQKYLHIMEDKNGISEFYADRYSSDTAQMVDLVWSARNNYAEWKQDKAKVRNVYNVGLSLCTMMIQRCL